MIGLSPENVQLAWTNAVAKAGNRKITAQIVAGAVKQLQLPPKECQAVEQPKGRTKTELRRLIDDAISQLLLLLSQKASHDVLTAHSPIQRTFHAQARFTHNIGC